MFGNSIDKDGFQRETTPMNPVNPYGCAKLFGYSIVRNYRHSYNLFYQMVYYLTMNLQEEVLIL